MANFTEWRIKPIEQHSLDGAWCPEHNCAVNVVFIPVDPNADTTPGKSASAIFVLKMLASFGEHMSLTPSTSPDGFWFRFHK